MKFDRFFTKEYVHVGLKSSLFVQEIEIQVDYHSPLRIRVKVGAQSRDSHLRITRQGFALPHLFIY